MGSQVISNFSLNILGGYTAGIRRFEAGGLFNIDKTDVQYVQVAGLLNLVGGNTKGVQASGLTNIVLGKVDGLQIAGINNIVLGKVDGLQIAGINNIVNASFKGVQISGIHNHIGKNFSGFQTAGLINYTGAGFRGLQVSGLLNIASRKMKGIQISGLLNYARNLHGMQIGILNIADSSDGISLGLLTIVKHGYNKLNLSVNELLNVNIAYKSGYNKFYNILEVGTNAGNNKNKLFSAGIGIGSNIYLSKNKMAAFNPELRCLSLYRGSWDYSNFLSKLHLNMNVKIAKGIELYGGPSLSLLYSNQSKVFEGYGSGLPPANYKKYKINDRSNLWIGWSTGLNIF